jgi:hypothetical protein
MREIRTSGLKRGSDLSVLPYSTRKPFWLRPRASLGFLQDTDPCHDSRLLSGPHGATMKRVARACQTI